MPLVSLLRIFWLILLESCVVSPSLVLSVGEDFGKSEDLNDLDGLNKLDKKLKKWKLIEEINHEIERLVMKEEDEKEKARIGGMTKLDLLKENFGK